MFSQNVVLRNVIRCLHFQWVSHVFHITIPSAFFDKDSLCVTRDYFLETSTFNRLPVVVGLSIIILSLLFFLINSVLPPPTIFKRFFDPHWFCNISSKTGRYQIYYDIKQEQRFTKVLKNWTELRLEEWQSLNN